MLRTSDGFVEFVKFIGFNKIYSSGLEFSRRWRPGLSASHWKLGFAWNTSGLPGLFGFPLYERAQILEDMLDVLFKITFTFSYRIQKEIDVHFLISVDQTISESDYRGILRANSSGKILFSARIEKPLWKSSGTRS